MIRNSLTIIFLIIILLASNGLFAEDFIIPENYIRQSDDQVVSTRTYNYLSQKADTDNLKIWIYFADKGIFEDNDFVYKAEQVRNSMSEKALIRRTRNNVPLSFRDLPVFDQYIKEIENRGLKIRRVSKWLNAASFETDIEKLDKIKDLPFVYKIVPVAGFTSVEPTEDLEDTRSESENDTGEKSGLSYGSSYTQVNQINVVAAHDSGFSGEGIIIAMFDTGFRKDHSAFADIISDGRLIAEYDFVYDDYETANEAEDISSQWEHGTKTWSTAGGGWSGYIYGPAYGASFILCKTEDMTQEVSAEEDDWVAAAEWVDSIGVDIISSSLGYSDWYDYEDLDGHTCTITIAAANAAAVGILVCSSAGNEGPSSGSITAPADADSILVMGAVGSTGLLTYFSSKGPTYDGRTKPEVCAQGSGVYVASPNSTTLITTASGTSFSCPLVAGAAALVMEARPDFNAMDVREALMMTASYADTPDNSYGWGIIDVMEAIRYNYTPPYLQGDPNYDGIINISDAVYIINYVFIGGAEPQPVLMAGDANDDGTVNVSDAVYLINFIFIPGSPAPPGYQE